MSIFGVKCIYTYYQKEFKNMKKCNYMPLQIHMNDVLDDNKFVVPQFQRSVVWKLKRRKDFISNIRNGEPFGVILIRHHNNKYELIDGLQRITTIRDYYANPFNYLSSSDVDSKLTRKIVVSHLTAQGLSIDEKYIEKMVPKLQSEIFLCLKGGLKNWKTQSVLKEKFGYGSNEINEIIDEIYEDFDESKEIGHLPIMAINYTGPSENIPNVFYNLNTGGVQLSKYETYSALWSTPLFAVNDEQLLKHVKNKYQQLQEDSELDVIFDEEDLSTQGISLFEYCYALSNVIRNKEKDYNILFGENTKSTDPIGFELLSLILGESVNKAERLYDLLKNVKPSFLCDIKKMIDESIFEIKNALRKTLIGRNGASLQSDSTYLIYHIIVSYIREYYSIDINTESIIKKSDVLPISDFRKYVSLHYVYDSITDYWRKNRQVSDLQRDLNDASKRRKYWSNIKPSVWEEGLRIFQDSQYSVAKTIPQKNKLFIDFLIKMKLQKEPQFNIRFLNNENDDSGFLDFEHIVPKKVIQNHIKDLTTSQQNLFSVSNVGNLCYLSVKDNRAKREKTIYEFVEDRPSYTFDYDYLSFINYPEKIDLKFLTYPNTDFREEYAKFTKQRTDALCVQFVSLIKDLY